MNNESIKKCKSCANCDKEMSNENWIVCPVVPMSVLVADDSTNCDNYKTLELSDD